jgi:hypothetical protein
VADCLPARLESENVVEVIVAADHVRTSTAGQAPCVSTEFGMIQTAWRTEDILKLAEQTLEAHVPADVEDVPDDAGTGEPFLACKLDWETWPCAASVLAEKYITMVGEYLVYWELRAERLTVVADALLDAHALGIACNNDHPDFDLLVRYNAAKAAQS